MSTPSLNPNDIGVAHDLRVLSPSSDYLNPRPRALFISAEGILVWEGDEILPAFPVSAGTIVLARPLRILPGTTATVVALY